MTSGDANLIFLSSHQLSTRTNVEAMYAATMPGGGICPADFFPDLDRVFMKLCDDLGEHPPQVLYAGSSFVQILSPYVRPLTVVILKMGKTEPKNPIPTSPASPHR